MPHPNIIPCVKLNLAIPIDLMTRLNLHLWSDVEHRVPKGSYQKLIVPLIREYLERIENATNT